MKFAALAAALLMAGCASPAQPVDLFFDFGGETKGSADLSGWSARADVPEDPDRPGQRVAWSVSACDEAGYEDHVHIVGHPVHSACFRLDGRQGDGTVWLSRAIPVREGTRYRVEVSVRAWEQESANTVADLVLRVGLQPARVEEDFEPRSGPLSAALRVPLDRSSGWVQHNLTWDSAPAPSTLALDFGVSAVWETEMTRYLDALHVRLTPI
jgi:hypothetical protein